MTTHGRKTILDYQVMILKRHLFYSYNLSDVRFFSEYKVANQLQKEIKHIK